MRTFERMLEWHLVGFGKKMSEHWSRWFCHVWHQPLAPPVRRGLFYQGEDIRRGMWRPRITLEKVVQRNMQGI